MDIAKSSSATTSNAQETIEVPIGCNTTQRKHVGNEKK